MSTDSGSLRSWPRTSDPEVVIVGAGPVGLSAANLLGALNVSTLLVEQHESTSTEAKAISLDDESLRTLQLADVDRAVYPILTPGVGTRYHGNRGQVLFHAIGQQRFGHPFKNPFAQPEFEQVLCASLDRFPAVTTMFATKAVEVSQGEHTVRVQLQHGSGQTDSIDARYVLGCDGGHSLVRDAMGACLEGDRFEDVWLVVDALLDDHDQRYGLHYGVPGRPTVIIPGRSGRCRYEFLLKPGEAESGQPVPYALVEHLLAPHRAVTREAIERAVTYTFSAVTASSWRRGRLFLLGDAAHMMPPFAGQGLNAGIRDVANLVWKLVLTLDGAVDDALLDTYESERRPHAEAMIELSVRLGRIVMTTSLLRALLRDVAVRVLRLTSRGRQYLDGMRFRPNIRHRRGFVTGPADPRDELTGRALPQPLGLVSWDSHYVRLDDVLGPGFSILGIEVSDQSWEPVLKGPLGRLNAKAVDVVLDNRIPRRHGQRDSVADADGALATLFEPWRDTFMLVRPDRIVASIWKTGRPEEAETLVETFFTIRTDEPETTIRPHRLSFIPETAPEKHVSDAS